MIFWKKICIDAREAKATRELILHKEAWQLLYDTLEERYKIMTNETSFARDCFGKPYLIAYPEIHFNISHSEELVACIIGENEVGMDVESIKPFPKTIIRKVCSPKEQESIRRAVHPNEQFFKLWTLKESYIKAVGKGLQLPMKSAVFHIRKDGKIESNQPDYTFRQKVIEGKYILSVCEQR